MSDTPLPLPELPSAAPRSAGQSGQSPPGQPGSGQSAKGSGTGATAGEAVGGPSTIVYDDFAKVQLRIGTVLEATAAPKGDKLLVLQVDLGDERRQILAGIRQHVTPEQMVGRQIVVVANLAPRQIMGMTSQGMLLAATDAGGRVVVVSPSEVVGAGSRVS